MTTYRRDGNHRIWRIEYVDASSEEFSYNGFGQVLTHRLTNGGTESFEYDSRGTKTAAVDPLGNRTTYSYDVNDHLSTMTDPRGNVWTYYHNQIGQRTIDQNPDGSMKGYTYDDAASRVTSVQTPETCTNFAYDDANREMWQDQLVAGNTWYRVQHDRDADGNAINNHVPGWFLVWLDYNQRGQLAHIYDGGGTPWFNYTYDAAGNMTQRQAPYAGANDSVNAWSQFYDPLNRPTMWENTGWGGSPYARSWYQYDTVGREVATWRDEQSSMFPPGPLALTRRFCAS